MPGAPAKGGKGKKVIIFQDGFETGDISLWNQVDQDGVVEVVPGSARTGVYGLHLLSPLGVIPHDAEVIKWFSPAGISHISAQFDLRVNSLTNPGLDNNARLRVVGITNVVEFGVNGPAWEFRLRNKNATWQVAQLPALTPGAWYTIEIAYDWATPQPEARCFINGQAVALLVDGTVGTLLFPDRFHLEAAGRDLAGAQSPLAGTDLSWDNVTLADSYLAVLPVLTTIELSPLVATNQTGVLHTLTATVRDQLGQPMPNVIIDLSSNMRVFLPATADAAGQVNWSWTSAVAGTENLMALAGGLTATATKVWTTPVVSSLNWARLSPATLNVGEQTQVQVWVYDEAGAPMPGVAVSLASTLSGPTPFLTQVTGADGSTVFSWTRAAAGYEEVTATAGGLSIGPAGFTWLLAPVSGGVTVLNQHYFSYQGQGRFLVGDSATQSVMQNLNVDYRAWIDDLALRGIKAAMIWAWMAVRQRQNGSLVDTRFGYVVPDLTPWARSGVGTARDGKSLWDLGAFDPAYWSRLDDLIAYAASRGLVVLITVWDGWAKDFPYHPFNVANGGPLPDVVDGRLNFATLADYANPLPGPYNPGWSTAQKNQWFQQLYADRLIQTVNAHNNVILELYNEGSLIAAYDDFWVRYFKARMAAPLEITDYYTDFDGRGSPLVDAISLHMFEYGPSSLNTIFQGEFAASPAKPAIYSEPVPGFYGNLGTISADQVRQAAWATAMAGGHFFSQDDTAFSFDPLAVQVDGSAQRSYLGYLNRFLHEMVVDFAAMAPRNDLASAGFCLAQPGVRYAVYLPSGGPVTLNLSGSAGTLSQTWLNPITGQIVSGPDFTAAPSLTFTPPFGGEVALVVGPSPGGLGSLTLTDVGPNSNPVGMFHEVQAQLLDQFGAPVVGASVTFTIFPVPFWGIAGGTAVTDFAGVARFSWTALDTGTQTMVATSGVLTSNALAETWTPNPPNAAALEVVDLTPGAPVGSTRAVEAHLTDSLGAGIAGVEITFFIDGVLVGTGITNTAGATGWSWSSPIPGSQTVGVRGAGLISALITVEWTAVQMITSVTLNPVVSAVNPVGSTAGFRATVLDENGVGVPGVQVDLTRDGILFTSQLTDAAGQTIFSITSVTAKTETLAATAGGVPSLELTVTWTQVQPGTLIFEDGFESGSFALWSGVEATGVGSVAQVIPGAAYAGVYGARMYKPTLTDNGYARCWKNFAPPSTNKVALQARVKILSASGDGNGYLLRLANDPATWLIAGIIRGGTTWQLILRNKDNTQSRIALAGGLAINTQYLVELLYDASGPNPVARAYVDSLEVASLTDLTTGALLVPNQGYLEMWEQDWNFTGEAYFDEAKIADGYIGVPQPPVLTTLALSLPGGNNYLLGQQITAVATATDQYGKPMPDVPVDFYVDLAYRATVPTGATGQAVYTWAELTVTGPHQVVAQSGTVVSPTGFYTVAEPPKVTTVILSHVGPNSNQVNTQHGVQAQVLDQYNDPMGGVSVNLYSNMRLFSLATTDANGIASWTWMGNLVGDETLQALAGLVNSNTIVKTWTAPVQVPSAISLTMLGGLLPVQGQQVSAVARVTDQYGVAMFGVLLDFYIDSIVVGQAITNASGDATFSWVNNVLGPHTIQARSGLLGSPVITFTVVSAPPVLTTLTLAHVGSDTNSVNTNHSVVATAYDQNGVVMKEVPVDFYLDGGLAGSGVTNAQGQATFTWMSSVSTIQVIDARSGTVQSNALQKSWVPPQQVIATVELVALSATTLQVGQTATLRATVKDTTGATVAGASVGFYVDGALMETATTNAQGQADHLHTENAVVTRSFQAAAGSVLSNTVPIAWQSVGIGDIDRIDLVHQGPETNQLGDSHGVLATVIFKVGATPRILALEFVLNGQLVGTVNTNPLGQAAFVWTRTPAQGENTDVVFARADSVVSPTLQKVWVAQAPTGDIMPVVVLLGGGVLGLLGLIAALRR